MARKAISKKLRFDVFKRDGFVCQYCGAHPPNALLQVDHIHPVALDGPTSIDNLITACQPCNAGKAATPLSVVPQGFGEKALEVAEREAQLAGYAEIMEAKRERLLADTWRAADALFPKASEDGLHKGKFNSVRHFVDALGIHEVLDGIDIAQAKYPWSDSKAFLYFCGICWRKIRELRGEP